MSTVFVIIVNALLLQLCYGQTVINIGGIFDSSYPDEYYAFLQAVDDVNNDNNLLSGIVLNVSNVVISPTSYIKETANMLSNGLSFVIGPRTSKSAEQLSPLFELTKTPYISYSATGNDLSNGNTFPYFYRVIPGISDAAIPILNVFDQFGWEQAVLLHSNGIWGRGLDFLVQIGTEKGISFKPVEIPSSYSSTEIAQLLTELKEYEVFIAHIPANQREAIFAAAESQNLTQSGYAWFGTEDVATSLDEETTSTQSRMEGAIGIRPKVPTNNNAQTLKDDVTAMGDVSSFNYYSYFAYDAVIMASYALDYMANEKGLDMTSQTLLNSNDYFGDIDSYLTFGEEFSKILLNSQLSSDWTMTGSLYLRGNTRRMPYEFVNVENGEWNVLSTFEWDSTKTDEAVNNDTDCKSLANDASNSDGTQYNELTQTFDISGCSLSENFTSSLQCDSDIINFYQQCFASIMGLDLAYTSSETSDDQETSDWIDFDITDVIWTGDSNSIPIGAQFSINNPIRVIVQIYEPWGELLEDDDDQLDGPNVVANYVGFLPTMWTYLTNKTQLQCTYFDGSGYSQNEVLTSVQNGTYDIALGAFTITSSRAANVRFFYQFYGGGLKIMTQLDPAQQLTWVFLRPFAMDLWFYWLVGIIGVAHLLIIMEWDTPTFRTEDEDTGILKRMSYSDALVEAMTMSSSVLYYTHDSPRGKHSRIFIAAWEYVVLILLSAYTANMASFLTTGSIAANIPSQEDDLYSEQVTVLTIPGSAAADALDAKYIEYTECGTPEICLDLMYNSISVNVSDSDSDTNSQQDYYDDNNQTLTFNAFVYDDINIEYWTSTSEQCSLITAGSSFNSFSSAIATRYGFIPDDIVDTIDLEIITLWSSGTITTWMNEYIFTGKGCEAYTESGDETTPMTVENFYYLWLFIGGGSLIFCTVVICTVERSQTPIDEQLNELNILLDKGGEEITRVGTLESTETQQNEDRLIAKRKEKPYDMVPLDEDLYDGRTKNDVDELARTITEKNEKKKNNEKQIELQEINKKPTQQSMLRNLSDTAAMEPKQEEKVEEEEAESKPEAEAKAETDKEALIVNDKNEQDAEEKNNDKNDKESSKSYEIKFDEDDNNDDNDKEKEKENDKEEWSKSYEIKFEYDDGDKKNDNNDDITTLSTQPKEMKALSSLSNDAIANAFENDAQNE